MSHRILFSPVGGTDPISLSNCKDGSLLHICRVYQPDKVYLYMSKQILALQEKDDRYRFCLKKLEELLGFHMEIEIFAREELENVQNFDFFYDEFKGILNQIMKERGNDDEVLINISSGTPAMKSGLLVLKTMGEIPCKAIQVVTPMKAMNEHIHTGYDVETLWELNEDNSPDFENRCMEVQCPSLSQIKNQEIIKGLIRSYDYSAALQVAKTLPESKSYIKLLEMADDRYLLNLKSAVSIANKYQIDCFPVKASSEIKYFEYAMGLEIRRKKGEYVDFIRAITPLVVDLFEMILRKQSGEDINEYCYLDRKGGQRWNKKKLEGTSVEGILKKRFDDFKGGYVSSIHLVELTKALSNDKALIDTVENMREVEENIRNLAAHQIITITEDSIKELTGFTSCQIMNLIKRTFQYTGINIRKEAWNTYDDMNEVICSRVV